jgi:hypothetical protein
LLIGVLGNPSTELDCTLYQRVAASETNHTGHITKNPLISLTRSLMKVRNRMKWHGLQQRHYLFV